MDLELKIELALPAGLYNCMTSILLSVIKPELAIKALIREKTRFCSI
jgi:hypothetical protein